MSEQGGVTELQSLEQEIAILKRVLAGCNAASVELTSVACARLIASIQSEAVHDSFVVGGSSGGGGDQQQQQQNQYHTSASGAAASDGGCCVVC